MPRIERDLRAIKSQVNREGLKFNDFLLENAFAAISTAIEPGVRLYQIDLASPGLKALMLRYSKFVLMFPDGSNPTVIELKIGNLIEGSTIIYIYQSGSQSWEQDIFPAYGYPVGSLIAGLDFQAYSVSAAASVDNNSGVLGGLHVQYNSGGRLSQTNMSSSDGGNESGKPFIYNHTTGEVQATKFKATDVVTADGGFNSAGLITSKQRHVIHCGFAHATASNVYLPFGYGGIFDSTSSSGYLEYGGFIAPCDGYVEFITVRGEQAGGNTSVAINIAGPHVEVPSLGPGSFSGGTVNMASDDVAYKWDTFTNQGGVPNSFNAGDVLMISMNTSAMLQDAIATAVLVLDWNNPL